MTEELVFEVDVKKTWQNGGGEGMQLVFGVLIERSIKWRHAFSRNWRCLQLEFVCKRAGYFFQCLVLKPCLHFEVSCKEHNGAGRGGAWTSFDGMLWCYRALYWKCTVQYSTVLYSTVQYCTVQYSTVQYSTVLYSTVQYCTVQYSTVQYSTVLYSTVQYCTVQ